MTRIQKCVGPVALEVETVGDDVDLDPIFALLPSCARDAGPKLTIRIELTARLPSQPLPAVQFHHGVVRGRLDSDGSWLVGDEESLVRIGADGTTVAGWVTPAGLEGHFVRTTLFISLAVALRKFGLFHIHCASLLDPKGQMVLLVGGSGAGKSTTAIALAEAGYQLLSDDVAFITLIEDRPCIVPFPKALHVDQRALDAFPERLCAQRVWRGPKCELSFEPVHVRPTPPATILFVKIGRAAVSEVSEVSAADALLSLIESSALVSIGALTRTQLHLDLLAQLAASAKTSAVLVGADALAAPHQLAKTLGA